MKTSKFTNAIIRLCNKPIRVNYSIDMYQDDIYDKHTIVITSSLAQVSVKTREPRYVTDNAERMLLNEIRYKNPHLKHRRIKFHFASVNDK